MKSRGRIMVVDDDALIVSLINRALVKARFEVQSYGDALNLEKETASFSPHLILLDIGLPQRSGLEALQGIKELDPGIHIVILTADDTLETAIKAMKLGASDYLTKPFEMERLISIVGNILEKENLLRKVDYLTRLSSPIFEQKFVGDSPEIAALRKKIVKLAGMKVSTILITGESGVGKEVLARHIHGVIHGGRSQSDAPFVAVNCAAIPERLLESELFGHTKGAFTDAKEDKRGMFELANNGSLLFDEIGEMRPDLQSKILRVLEDRKVRRIGGRHDIPVDVTVIATTNADISKNVQKGLFRSDLYYRLATFEFQVPPLRERVQDIIPIASYFLEFYSEKYQKRIIDGFSPEAEKMMTAYTWPGNVRELRNVIERIVVLENTDMVLPDLLPGNLASHSRKNLEGISTGIQLPEEGISLEEVEKKLIAQALEKTGNNRAHAAKMLSVGYDALRYKIRKFGLE